MAGLFTADIENRGLVLDPRTKLAVMITLVVFCTWWYRQRYPDCQIRHNNHQFSPDIASPHGKAI